MSTFDIGAPEVRAFEQAFGLLVIELGYNRGNLVFGVGAFETGSPEDSTGLERRWLGFESDLWVYPDGRLVGRDEPPCVKCGRVATPLNGPDPCLGLLVGVAAACCGHGVEEPYVLPRGGVDALRGQAAFEFWSRFEPPLPICEMV